MSDFKLAYTADNELTPMEIAKAMLAAASDGAVYIPGFPFDDVDESELVYRCHISAANAEKTNFFRRLVRSIDDPVKYLTYSENGIIADALEAVVNRLMRLRLISAPETVIRNEEKLLAAMLVLNRFAVEIEVMEENMNKLEFEKCENLVKVLVDGIDIVNAVNETSDEVRHDYITARVICGRMQRAEDDPRAGEYQTYLGCCAECGDIGCDPLSCVVSEKGSTVKWDVGNFDNPKIFHFEFDIDSYKEAMAHLAKIAGEGT